MAAADPNEALAVLEPRALRQFTDPDYQGPKIYLAPKAFEDKVRASLVRVRVCCVPGACVGDGCVGVSSITQ